MATSATGPPARGATCAEHHRRTSLAMPAAAAGCCQGSGRSNAAAKLPDAAAAAAVLPPLSERSLPAAAARAAAGAAGGGGGQMRIKQRDDGGVAAPQRQHHRRVARGVGGVCIGARRQQLAHQRLDARLQRMMTLSVPRQAADEVPVSVHCGRWRQAPAAAPPAAGRPPVKETWTTEHRQQANDTDF